MTLQTPFCESFEAAVQNNTDLSPVEKFNYLMSILDDSAQDAISGISLAAMNYNKAIAISVLKVNRRL